MLMYEWNDEQKKQLKKNLTKVKNLITKDVNKQFLTLSLNWLQNKSIEYLRANFPNREDNNLIAEISSSFVKENDGQVARLINTHENAVYIEFGVGIIGQDTHPISESAKITGGAYKYNLPSKAKEYAKEKTGQEDSWFYKGLTQGNKASMYMYNAFMDFKNGVYRTIYQQAFKEVLSKLNK
jgi:hypothetical protein